MEANSVQKRIRPPLLLLGMITLLVAIWVGVARLPWDLPISRTGVLKLFHGPLMVPGFLGTLISLERAVALGKGWSYSAPLMAGLGSLAIIVGLPETAGQALITAGSIILVIIFVFAIKRQPELFTWIMALGAVALLAGNIIWMAIEPPYFTPSLWWAAFLIFTITGERLELARLLRITPGKLATFLLALALYLVGMVVANFSADIGMRLVGAGLIALTVWLLAYDIARRTVKQKGLTRFISVCLLSGYVWLGAAGVMALAYGGVQSGFRYDAILHAIFLGFTFAMIFGHAPIIFPAVLNLPMTYNPFYYAPLVLLHITLALRVIGDLAEWLPGRRWGGLLNGAVLAIFLANTAYSVITTKLKSRQAPRVTSPTAS